ncbi:uncharacterized protein L201_002580 [Kwoniella dendrophila CBS 6074]|uniref:Uncharacterized protein n=1 Tax=Kwoniella dendrophila CBS 6074 TaxID=1295534 RepID=A0AAX4JT98_9TREE
MVSGRHDFTDSEPEAEMAIDSGMEELEAEVEAGPSNPRKRQLSDGNPASSTNGAATYSRGNSEDFDELLDEDDNNEGEEEIERVKPKSITIKPPSSSSSSKKGKKGKEGSNPLKITLRPGITNLVNNDSPSSSSTKGKTKQPKIKAKSLTKRHKTSDRSSLSPPPPITLKFGLKSTTMAEKATYSSSEEDQEDNEDRVEEDDNDNDDPISIPPPKQPPSKKKKLSLSTSKPSSSTTTNSSNSKGKSKSNQEKEQKLSTTALASAAHKKSYDWLAPSVAGASHRRPPERERQNSLTGSTTSNGNSNSNSKITGWSPADEAIGGLLDDKDNDISKETNSPDITIEKKPKKQYKKKAADAPPGPGKAWRKGIKKGMTTAVKAEDGLSTPGGSPLIQAATPISRDASPAPLEMPPRMIGEKPIPPVVVPPPRAPSPPFILADTQELGFPVYPNPIHAPKVPLGNFPKVTQYFAPLNGGDVGPFPRKEPVRNWTHSEKVMIGVGGGQLKIKSWFMGPPSELGRLVQADKEAKELARLAKIKSNNTNKENAQSGGTATPTGGGTSNLDPNENRPSLTTANSFDNSNSNLPTPELAPTIIPAAVVDTNSDVNKTKDNNNDEETMSELMDLDDNESLIPQSGTTTPVPATTTSTTKIKMKITSPSTGGKTKKNVPRKSNLRKEIIVQSEDNSELDVDPTPSGVGVGVVTHDSKEEDIMA